MEIAIYDPISNSKVSFIQFDPSLGAITLEPTLSSPLGMSTYYY